MHRTRCRVAACMLATAVAGVAHGGIASLQECVEASDFVANAARARDNGMTREAFIARLEDDFIVIRAYPPALRWFVRDEDDERFLRESVRAVYDRPLLPERHREAFLVACLDRAGMNAASAD